MSLVLIILLVLVHSGACSHVHAWSGGGVGGSHAAKTVASVAILRAIAHAVHGTLRLPFLLPGHVLWPIEVAEGTTAIEGAFENTEAVALSAGSVLAANESKTAKSFACKAVHLGLGQVDPNLMECNFVDQDAGVSAMLHCRLSPRQRRARIWWYGVHPLGQTPTISFGVTASACGKGKPHSGCGDPDPPGRCPRAEHWSSWRGTVGLMSRTTRYFYASRRSFGTKLKAASLEPWLGLGLGLENFHIVVSWAGKLSIGGTLTTAGR